MLVTAGWLLTSPADEPLREGAAVIRGSQIIEVGPAADLKGRYPEEEVWEGDDQVLAPGLVNTHTHLYGVLAHGISLAEAPNGFWPFLKDFWWPRVEDRVDQPLLRAAVAASCLELLRSGVTTFYDILEAPNVLPGALEAEAEVVRRFGLRCLLSFEATGRSGAEKARLGLQENAAFLDAHRGDPLLGGTMCFHTTFTCSPELIRRAAEMARERDAVLHMHLSESRYEGEQAEQRFGRRPVEYYDQLGILGPNVLASQCVHVTPAERAIMAEREVKAAHMPLSNCEVGGGIAPVPEMLDAGITVGLGSDSYIEDFFQVMRGAFLIHKARLETPLAMPARTVWRMATEGGARALGLDRIGALRPGWSADMVMLDADLPIPLTSDNIWDLILLYRGPQHVRGVICAGQPLLWDGKLLLDVDEAEIHAKSREAARRLWADG